MNKVIVGLIIAVVIAVVGYFLLGNLKTPAPSLKPGPQALPSAAAPVTVDYTDAGYTPTTLRVTVGTAVTFKNESSKPMWTSSAFHPSHTGYSGASLREHCPDTAGTAFDACTGTEPGHSWSFTFGKKGAWGYHNHLAPGDTGTVVVE